jgi:hypothetical protein
VTDHEPLLGLFQKNEFPIERQEKMVLSILRVSLHSEVQAWEVDDLS